MPPRCHDVHPPASEGSYLWTMQAVGDNGARRWKPSLPQPKPPTPTEPVGGNRCCHDRTHLHLPPRCSSPLRSGCAPSLSHCAQPTAFTDGRGHMAGKVIIHLLGTSDVGITTGGRLSGEAVHDLEKRYADIEKVLNGVAAAAEEWTNAAADSAVRNAAKEELSKARNDIEPLLVTHEFTNTRTGKSGRRSAPLATLLRSQKDWGSRPARSRDHATGAFGGRRHLADLQADKKRAGNLAGSLRGCGAERRGRDPDGGAVDRCCPGRC